MTTTVTKSIGSGGGRDYSTIALFLAAVPADLTATDEVWVGELYNDSEFDLGSGTLFIESKVTDSTRYIHLKAADGESFADHANVETNALRYNASNGVAIKSNKYNDAPFWVSVDFTRLTGLQFKTTNTCGTSAMITFTGESCLVTDCIFETAVAQNSVYGTICREYDSARFINCAFIAKSTIRVGVSLESPISGKLGGYLHNCTIVALSSGIGDSKAINSSTGLTLANRLIKNTAGFGWVYFVTNTTAATGSDYNATDASTAPGSNSQTGLVFADQFVSNATDGTHDMRVDAGSDLVAGTRDQTYTSDLDIAGRSRDTTTPTVGAWEYASGSLGGSKGKLLILGVG